MPKMICICILLIYFKVISKKGGHYCPRLPYNIIFDFTNKTFLLRVFIRDIHCHIKLSVLYVGLDVGF